MSDQDTDRSPSPAHGDALPAQGAPQRPRHLLLSLAAVAVVVTCALPFSTLDVGGRPSFVPAVLALVCGLDLLSAVLLVRQFRDAGERRALVLASSYVFSLAVLAGYGAAFPGVLGDVGPLGAWPSTAPWLWVAWHTGFPVLLAIGVAPWPRRWSAPARVQSRGSATWWTLTASLVAGGLVVLAAVTGRGWLPVLIDGLDTSAMTRVTGPVMLPVVALATVVAVVGALRLSGPVRWAALAAAAALGDVVLTLFSFHRYSLGWYAGRSLTVVSCAVVLVAMLAEFGRLKAQLAVEADRLRSLLGRTRELEGLQSTLLNLMTDGVMLHGADGRVVVANPAA
jgi:PAS domain-containing protein